MLAKQRRINQYALKTWQNALVDGLCYCNYGLVIKSSSITNRKRKICFFFFLLFIVRGIMLHWFAIAIPVIDISCACSYEENLINNDCVDWCVFILCLAGFGFLWNSLQLITTRALTAFYFLYNHLTWRMITVSLFLLE